MAKISLKNKFYISTVEQEQTCALNIDNFIRVQEKTSSEELPSVSPDMEAVGIQGCCGTMTEDIPQVKESYLLVFLVTSSREH